MEGEEVQVLAKIPFSKVSIRAIIVADTFQSYRFFIAKYLERKNFRLEKSVNDERDLIFVQKN